MHAFRVDCFRVEKSGLFFAKYINYFIKYIIMNFLLIFRSSQMVIYNNCQFVPEHFRSFFTLNRFINMKINTTTKTLMLEDNSVKTLKRYRYLFP